MHTLIRQDEQQLIVDSDGFINLFMKLLSTLDAFWSVPASDTMALERIMHSSGEPFVVMRIPDEA